MRARVRGSLWSVLRIFCGADGLLRPQLVRVVRHAGWMKLPVEFDPEQIQALPPEERARVAAEIQLYERIARENPLWRWLPHEGERGWALENGLEVRGTESRGQVEFLEACGAGTFVVAAVAGNRFGKTEVGVVEAAVQTLPVHALPPWLQPFKVRDPESGPVQWRFVGVDLGNWLAKAMLPKARKLLPKASLWKGDFDKAWNDRERKLRFADGSWWDFLTHDMELDSFASADLDGITYDEEPPGTLGAQQWEEGLGRLVDRAGVIRCTLTPLLGLSWLYRELSENDVPRRDDEVHVVTGSIDHNPNLSAVGRDRAIRQWEKKDPMRAQARRHGMWVHFEGLIFPDFSREKHVVPDLELEARDQIVEGIDPGMAEDHPAGFVVARLTADDRVEVVHTHQIWQGTAEDMSRHIHDTRAQLGYRPRWTVIDPSARNKNHQTGRSIQDEYRKHQVFTIPGQNSRLASYNAITERLKGNADGSVPPRLVVFASCDDLVGQVENYRWKKKKRAQSEDAQAQEPIKINDDLIDPLRYIVMQLPPPAKKREPIEVLSGPEQAVREHLRRAARGGRRARVGGAI